MIISDSYTHTQSYTPTNTGRQAKKAQHCRLLPTFFLPSSCLATVFFPGSHATVTGMSTFFTDFLPGLFTGLQVSFPTDSRLIPDSFPTPMATLPARNGGVA